MIKKRLDIIPDGLHIPFLKTHFIVEAILQWWADTEMTAIVSLGSLTQHVGGRVPEHLFTILVLEIQQLQLAGTFQRTDQIPKLTVDLRDNSALGKGLCNTQCNIQRRGFPRGAFFD